LTLSDFPPSAPVIAIVEVTPSTSANADMLAVMQAILPDVVAVEYEDLAPWPRVGPKRAYKISVWTRLAATSTSATAGDSGSASASSPSPARYLRIAIDESISPSGSVGERGSFALFDLLLRGGIGIAVALLIASWISKPLTRLAASADATLPSGELKPGAERLNLDREPTEIAHTLAAIERMRARIGAMVSERTTMLTALAHDLRTPLTRLTLRLALSKDDRLREDATGDVQKMQSLITRTLDFIRSADPGAGARTTERADLREVIANLIAGLPQDDARRIVVDGLDDSVFVAASEWSMERVMSNLVENALKYSPPSSAVLISLVKSADRDDSVTLRVRDHGPGVPREALARLSEPFYRVDEARDIDAGGSGLGLSIVDNIIRRINGGERAWQIENHPDGGLVVSIQLPRAAE
jgi:signal transduction histidine kinase